jgi:hypothetical protein
VWLEFQSAKLRIFREGGVGLRFGKFGFKNFLVKIGYICRNFCRFVVCHYLKIIHTLLIVSFVTMIKLFAFILKMIGLRYDW